MKESLRKLVFDKCNGRCAFCGTPLTKGWHASKIKNDKVVTKTGDIQLDDNINNLIPACAPCNLSRIHNSETGEIGSIEDFKKELAREFNWLKTYSDYKKALRFGLITETNKEIQFYFETLK